MGLSSKASPGLYPIYFDLEGDFVEDVSDALAGGVRAGVADGSTARVGAERDREGLVRENAGGFSDLADYSASIEANEGQVYGL